MLLWLLGCWMAPPMVQAEDGEELSYNGSFSQTAPGYARGKPVSISHSGGNVSVRCIDTQELSARLAFKTAGFVEASLRAFGDGLGMATAGDTAGGSVKTKIPSKTGINSADVELTVNVPLGPSGVTVTQSGTGWVEVMNCAGAIKVTSGTGGVYVSGKLTAVNIAAPGGNIKVEQAADGVLTGASSLSAPGGSILMLMPGSQAAKLTAKAATVTVSHLVMGQNGGSLVQGDINGGTTGGGVVLNLTARDRVELKQP